MIEKALSSVKETLAVDGYTLSAKQGDDGVIEVVIEAGPTACAECLIPKDILEKIITKVLQENEVPFNKVNISTPSFVVENY